MSNQKEYSSDSEYAVQCGAAMDEVVRKWKQDRALTDEWPDVVLENILDAEFIGE